jgi:hypothetical protein
MQQKSAASRQYAKALDYKRTFESKSGQRVLQDLMDVHHMLRLSFDEKNPQVTAFREGERNVVIRILSILKTDIEKLKVHIEEIERNAREYTDNTHVII